MGGYPSAANPFIFNGDMVDRGSYSMEIMLSLLEMKLQDPAAVHLLRGNHETPEMYYSFGFMQEVWTKYDNEVFKEFEKLLVGE